MAKKAKGAADWMGEHWVPCATVMPVQFNMVFVHDETLFSGWGRPISSQFSGFNQGIDYPLHGFFWFQPTSGPAWWKVYFRGNLIERVGSITHWRHIPGTPTTEAMRKPFRVPSPIIQVPGNAGRIA